MHSHALQLDEFDAISPSLEMGAFEALWANGVHSFKQLSEKLHQAPTGLLSSLVQNDAAKSFYQRALERLSREGVTQFGIRITGTIDYPHKLEDADYPSTLLYYQGNWDLIYTKGIAVVGTRKPSPEGIKRAKRVTQLLVKQGYTIYSGLAAGIDTIAHQTAIEEGGKTIAILGTPLWMRYPLQNTALQDLIAAQHLLISQVPIVSYETKGIPMTRMFFPERNKTMAALSDATLIVEAGETSGTLIQAKAALKQGRKVFILNNNFENPVLTWPAKLEKAGAIRVREIADLIQGLQSE